jgi:hypothetical protein
MKKIYLIFSLMLTSALNYAQLQNLDFEEWHNPITELGMNNRPVGWIWTNGMTTWEESYFYNAPHTDAQSNDYALTLSIWYNHTKDAAVQGALIDYRPAQLKGYYKYTDNVIYGQTEGEINDTAMVAVYLTKFIMGSTELDTIGMGKVNLNYSEGYSLFEVDIAYTSDEVPNLVTIVLDPSLVNRYEGRYYSSQPEAVASFFTIDNLSLEGEAVVSTDDADDLKDMSIYPNPAQNTLRIDMDERKPIAIYTTTGVLVNSLVVNTTHTLDVSNYPSGVYVIKSNEDVLRFIKE